MVSISLDLTYTAGSAGQGIFRAAQPAGGSSHLGTVEVEGNTYHYFKSGNDRVYLFESAESRTMFLDNICLRMGVPLTEANALKSWDINKLLPRGAGVELRNGSVGFGTGFITLVSDERVVALNNEADGDFFGKGVPTFPPEVKPFLANRNQIQFTGSPVNDGRLLAAIQGTAFAIYKSNYSNLEANQNPLVNLGQLDDSIENLAMKIFGIPKEQITQGHVNTLRLMGLIDGGPVDTGGANVLRLSTEGTQLLAVFTGGTAATAFIASINTFIDANALAKYNLMFDEQGGLKVKPGTTPSTKYTLVDVSTAVKALLPAGETQLPSDVTVDSATFHLGKKMFGLDADKTRLTVEQVNTLIAAGLVAYNPATGAVTLTEKGQNLPLQ